MTVAFLGDELLRSCIAHGFDLECWESWKTTQCKPSGLVVADPQISVHLLLVGF